MMACVILLYLYVQHNITSFKIKTSSIYLLLLLLHWWLKHPTSFTVYICIFWHLMKIQRSVLGSWKFFIIKGSNMLKENLRWHELFPLWCFFSQYVYYNTFLLCIFKTVFYCFFYPIWKFQLQQIIMIWTYSYRTMYAEDHIAFKYVKGKRNIS